LVEEINFGSIRPVPPEGDSPLILKHIKPEQNPIHLGAAFWVEKEWSDFLYLDWQHGCFATIGEQPPVITFSPKTGKHTTRPGIRLVAYGVTFPSRGFRDLLRVRSRLTEPLEPSPNKPPKMRATKPKYDWDKILAPLKQQAENGLLEEGYGSFSNYGAKAELEKRIRILCGGSEGGPAESTIKRRRDELIELNEKNKPAAELGNGPCEPKGPDDET
jgi:hypothetical protein